MLTLTLLSATLLAQTPAAAKAPTPDDAKAFVKKLDTDLRKLFVRSATAEWLKSTYITDDSERNAASMNEDLMAYVAQAVRDAQKFKGLKLDPDTERMLYLLRFAANPSPANADKRAEIAALAAKLEGMYGKGKACKPGKPGKDGKPTEDCRDLQQLSEVLSRVGDKKKPASYDEMLEAWTAWHATSKEMKPFYEKFVGLSNEGAKDFGAADLGDLWRGAYDMSSADFEKETDRLWLQVKPLYDDLHCYVRSRLSKKFGADKVATNGPMPAHVLGNMWAQEWGNVYPLVEPYAGQANLDVTSKLKAQKVDEKGLVKMGENFFTSLGMDPLPPTFWERSQFTKPRDRDVVCHASAWDVQYANDLRIKMCIKVDEEDLITVHHELGHDYYYMNYFTKPVLFQSGANDGFHEAIGDALTLSITPEYLKSLKLLDQLPKDEKGLINFQMKDALDKVAFLPFARMMDQWRWDVFAGKVKASDYNKHWWELRLKYQGITPAGGARGDEFFDPGAKYHIPANVPYMRYFLARILQFQFHRAMCKAAGHTGPLHTCSIYGNKAAGAKLKAMLEMGASKPWPDALETLTGQRQMDATAILDYFAPLHAWLKEQNKGQQCGW
ncbi:MAG: M2 family metallopeptidase [Myxococcaceae bacterium]